MPTSRPLPLLYPNRVRRLPHSFAWVDHRLRSTGILQFMNGDDIGLYLFLALASDKHGLSCWRLDRVERELPWISMVALRKARERLIDLDLLAYNPWCSGAVDGSYQLLAVPLSQSKRQSSSGPVSIGALLPKR